MQDLTTVVLCSKTAQLKKELISIKRKIVATNLNYFKIYLLAAAKRFNENVQIFVSLGKIF